MKPTPDFAAIILAAGSSSRMGGLKKEYCPLAGTNTTVLGQAVAAFAAIPCIASIVIAVPENGETAARQALPPELFASNAQGGVHSPQSGAQIFFVTGGSTRRASVHNALSFLASQTIRYVLIHDGGRPWVSVDLIERTIAAVRQHQAAIPLLPLTETPKETDAPFSADSAGDAGAAVFVKRQLRRACVGVAQTPQGFAFPQILSAHEQAAQKEKSGECEASVKTEYTDDAEVWGEFCGAVAVVPGEIENRKITFANDLCINNHTKEG